MEATVRAYVDALNSHEPDAVAALVTDDFVNEHTAALAESSAGRAAYRARLPQFFADMPELTYEIEDLVVDGARAVVAYVLTARPGGRAVRVRGVLRLFVTDGRLARRVDYWDALGFLRQTGVDDSV